MGIGDKMLNDANAADKFRAAAMAITGNDIQILDMTDEDLRQRIAVVRYALNILEGEAKDRGVDAARVPPPGVDPVDF